MKSKEAMLPLNLQFFAEDSNEPEQTDPATTPNTETQTEPEKEDDKNLATELAKMKAELAKQKVNFDKVMSENGTLRKKLKEKQTAEEAELEAKAEAEAAEKERIANLERELNILHATEDYMAFGMDKETAKATAELEVDGKKSEVRAAIAKWQAEDRKAYEAEIKQKYLGEMANLHSGNNGQVDYIQEYNKALENGDRHSAILAQLQQGNINGSITS